MRKYIFVLFAFVFVSSLFIYNVTSAGVSNCAFGGLFNSITGKTCVNNINNNNSQRRAAVPRIFSVSPTSGAIGSQVTIYGNGFAFTGNGVNFGSGYIPDLTSTSGKQITFTVPGLLDPSCRFLDPPCMVMTKMTQPGNYSVSVSNANGTSNAVNFTVTGTGAF